MPKGQTTCRVFDRLSFDPMSFDPMSREPKFCITLAARWNQIEHLARFEWEQIPNDKIKFHCWDTF